MRGPIFKSHLGWRDFRYYCSKMKRFRPYQHAYFQERVKVDTRTLNSKIKRDVFDNTLVRIIMESYRDLLLLECEFYSRVIEPLMGGPKVNVYN